MFSALPIQTPAEKNGQEDQCEMKEKGQISIFVITDDRSAIKDREN